MEEIAQRAMELKHTSVLYMEKNSLKVVVDYILNTGTGIIKDGTFVVKRVVTNTIFNRVTDYKKNIIYDHFREKRCLYIDNVENAKRYQDTLVLPVIKSPSDVTDIISQTIFEKLKV